MLRELGYAVLEAADPGAALALLEARHPVDLLFSDVVMPGPITLAEMVSRARAVAPHLKVLFTSGYTEDRIKRASLIELGAPLLGKPYRIDELAAKIKSVMVGA
jgi:CheY-like chemotaxis protein